MQIRNRIKELLRDYIESLLVAIILALIIRSFVLSAFKIQTSSMWPTLQAGDFVFAFKVPYGLRVPIVGKKILAGAKPHRGDVVLFRYQQDETIWYIKRVAAVGGDKIEIRDRRLYVNDTPAIYSDAKEKDDQKILVETLFDSNRSVAMKKDGTAEPFGPTVVPPDYFFVLGDNRDSSDDSRYWGPVPIQNIDGLVFGIWLALDWDRTAIKWDRVMTRIR